MGTSPTVFIFPEEIELTAGPASFHRQFLDLYISQYSKSYLDDLISYRKIILQRNKLLKEIFTLSDGENQLEAWNNLLVDHGVRIIAARKNFIESIEKAVRDYYNDFDSKSKIDLYYRPKINPDEDNLRKSIMILLETYKKREMRAGMTLVGPHRDRLKIDINGKSVRHFGSRGQKRCAMIAMKLAVADYLTRIKEEPTTLILDEVFAELDVDKSQALIKILSNYNQVFMATAGEYKFDNNQITKFYINNGKIGRKENDNSN